MRIIVTLLLTIIFTAPICAQASTWTRTSARSLQTVADPYLKRLPKSSVTFKVDSKAFAKQLQAIKSSGVAQVYLPAPSGEVRKYELTETIMVAPEVAQFYTAITFKGHATEDPSTIIRCGWSDQGFRALVLDPHGSYVIEPISKSSSADHIVYLKSELEVEALRCGYSDEIHKRKATSTSDRSPNATTLRTFRVAMLASGETSVEFGGSPYSATNVLNTLLMGLNQISGIYERDLAVSFVSVSTPAMIYPDPATDPFDLSDQMALVQTTHSEIVSLIGTSGFDIGHLFVYSNEGGLAANGACDNTIKGEGFSGSNASLNSLFVDYGAHEIGHQLGALHNFVSQECMTSTSQFRYEPGEGSSIMAYAGVCGGTASYQNSSDPYFHSKSIESMNADIAMFATCHTTSSPGNGNPSPPTADARQDIIIPKSTPFVLVGSGGDASTTPTYLWEQVDGGGTAVSGPPNCSSTTHPMFRYRPPVSVPIRSFPEVGFVLAGQNTGNAWEVLPCEARTMNFNLIVRDNDTDYGCIANDQMVVTVANTGPFEVTAPNGGESWTAATEVVTWTENGTAAHCPTVDILLSQDGGFVYSIIASNVTNDGSHSIAVSGIMTTTARVLVQCSTGGQLGTSSTFYDIGDGNFTINSAIVPVDLVSFDAQITTDDAVRLSWTTSREINSSHYQVEHSTDGTTYRAIGTVEAIGSSDQYTDYTYLHSYPVKGINYYRLRQVDQDGTSTYYDAAAILFDKSDGNVSIWPNPTTGLLYFEGIQEGDEIIVQDALGRTVAVDINKTVGKLDASALPNGLYYISVSSQRGTSVHSILLQ